MSQASIPSTRATNSLRLFEPTETDTSTPPPLSSEMTLGEFFDAWYLPIVLTGESASESTITLYRNALHWWATLTPNPPIRLISEFTIADFKPKLNEATWRRGVRGVTRRLAKATIAKHLKAVRAVLRRAGPTVDTERPCKHLVDQVPHIRVHKVRTSPKPAFEIAIANRIVAAAPRLSESDLPWELPQQLWWQGLLLVLYYTGLRTGTVRKLRWSMIAERSSAGVRAPFGGAWLIVPGEIVDKTDKPLDKFLHPIPLRIVERLNDAWREPPPDPLLFPWPHCVRHLGRRHDRLQHLAGINEANWLSPHAWRRTHGMAMGRVGAGRGIEIAQHALDHADERTTRESYVDIEPELILQLPRIDELAARNTGARQLDLF